MIRDWLRGAFRASLTTAGLTLLAVGPLFGQASTGKIQGRVTDAGTGAPIAGAQVLVDESTLGNLTNDQGFYFINEVPAGLQSVRAQFIGYRPFVIEGQRILAGQTTTLNFELEQTAVELEAITVEGERNPLVPRDQTSTKSIVQGEVIDQLPLDNASSIVVLQPGVIQTNRGVTIRGGRANEEAVFIDGVLIRSFGQAQANNVNLPTNALEQVDVNVGAFAAEFGEAQSGVVSYVTRSGGAQFTGSLEMMTDQVTNSWRTNFNRAELTRDHVRPTSRGGTDRWENVVAACKRCNWKKDSRTPEEANMPLLAVPFRPNPWEWHFLAKDRILVDQMDYLSQRFRAQRAWAA